MLIELFSSFPLFFLFSFYIQSSIEVFHLISSHWFIFARDKFFLALENRNIIANFQCISIFESLLSEKKTEFFRNKFTKIFNNFPPLRYTLRNREKLLVSTSRFNFSQGGAEQIPTILRIFGRGVPFAGMVGGEGVATEGKL